jgi:hypothetical protein
MLTWKARHRSPGFALRESLIVYNHSVIMYPPSRRAARPLNFGIWVSVVYELREHDVASTRRFHTMRRHGNTDQEVERLAENVEIR